MGQPWEEPAVIALLAPRRINQQHACGLSHHHRTEKIPGGPIFVPGSAGAEINDAVRPATGEPVITKNFPNSFRDTRLSDLLKEKGVEEVVVVGVMSHMCVDATVRAANDLGYKTTTIHDACATRDMDFDGITTPAAQVHAALMAALASAYGEVISTDAYLAR
ncbi:isochorismatase family protein [Sinorhizobium meliloti]|uniref:isochorismatase family protein n=1 Tax=Rhizobium meliloti TaxID=382 RepID=UPI0013E39FB4|nr:isochorismatase family protein [Sinorhizobium meliloti]